MEPRDPTLDQSEQQALDEWLALLHEGAPEVQPRTDTSHAFRGSDGRIVVPVVVRGTAPSLSLALLMAQKDEQIYRQFGVRLQIAQRPDGDPKPQLHLWDGQAWVIMAWRSPAP